MDHDQLQFDLRQSASLRLLKSPNAPLILSFLHRMFKREQRVSIPYAVLLERLDATLEALNERSSDMYPLSAATYLKQWSDEEHQLLRIIVRSSDDETTVELTADAERAIGWVEELYRREFVGTESRFLSIFNLLEEIVAHSTEDVGQRLTQLEQERAAIDAEITRICVESPAVAPPLPRPAGGRRKDCAVESPAGRAATPASGRPRASRKPARARVDRCNQAACRRCGGRAA